MWHTIVRGVLDAKGKLFYKVSKREIVPGATFELSGGREYRLAKDGSIRRLNKPGNKKQRKAARRAAKEVSNASRKE